ncbi:hypothetical protein F5Y19DRAFT_458381 [Xylariaceae sp. FL1651]|nr:hypothetical protein F5Y19DRAFT_458381 [Xylariaceae sp. FL1651]
MENNTTTALRIWEAARSILRPLVKHSEAYLTDQDLKKLNITCTDLDLSTGKPADGSEIFTRPFSTARIHEILERTKPWLRVKLLDEKDSMPMVAALEILSCLISYLVHDGDNESTPLIMEAHWDKREMQYDEGERLYRSERHGTPYGPEWRVEKVLDKMDGSTPHITCLLADNAPLRDNQLSNAEIWCILAITNRRLQLYEYHNHRIIPVTVISAADRQLRIVQGYVDGQHGYLRVRKSPIIDFQQYDLQRMELVLSWCLGEPVGHTKP